MVRTSNKHPSWIAKLRLNVVKFPAVNVPSPLSWTDVLRPSPIGPFLILSPIRVFPASLSSMNLLGLSDGVNAMLPSPSCPGRKLRTSQMNGFSAALSSFWHRGSKMWRKSTLLSPLLLRRVEAVPVVFSNSQVWRLVLHSAAVLPSLRHVAS
jgi:hypothetical protein